MPFHILNRIDQHSFHYLLLPDGKPARRHTALKGFDLSLGTPKLHWNLPNGKIYKLPAGASAAELFLEHRTLMGVDGIAFLDGVLYVNNVVFNNLYRIPVDPEGKPSQSVDIWTDQPVSGPDGMRAANGKLIVAENGSGKISAITVHGDKASVTVLKEGLKTPTGVKPAGDTLWIAKRGAGKAVSIPMPK